MSIGKQMPHSICIAIERDRGTYSHGARFRVKVRTQPGAPALLTSTRLCSSVTQAKADAEATFGNLGWRDNDGEVRALAILEWEAAR